jgi:hypothetical protein
VIFLSRESPHPHFPRTLRIIRIILVLAGCLHLCGGPYGVIQVFAWGKMIVDYSAEKGFVEGVKDTFDGQHPCELCHSIAKAEEEKSESQETPLLPDLRKLELKNILPTECLTARKPISSKFLPPAFAEPGSSLPLARKSPDTPPPRLA